MKTFGTRSIDILKVTPSIDFAALVGKAKQLAV